MLRKSYYFEIFAVSLAAILLEISYTRIFSFKVWYYFTYPIIGFALLGLGAGGVLVAVSHRLHQIDPARVVPKLCVLAGASVLAGYLIIAYVQLNILVLTFEPIEIAKLVGTCMVLVIPFLTSGIIISKILSTSPEAAGRLYGADLLGAAFGCIVCIPLLILFDPPRTVMLAGLIFTIGGLRSALRSRFLRVAGGVLCIILLLPITMRNLLPDPIVSYKKNYGRPSEEHKIPFSRWHPVFRVDAAPSIDGSRYMLYHDGELGSSIHRVDDDFSNLEFLRTDSRALPFEVLPKRPKVLIIGMAGGYEVLASLFFGAGHVTGIELNPVTLSLLTHTYADFSGRLNENPKVTLICGEGRWFMKQSEEKYDLIWFVAPDSYAAMNASSSAGFVLVESYLYTVEMLRESLQHLTKQGIICAQFGEEGSDMMPLRTIRYIATARQAFMEQKVPFFERHIAVSKCSAFPLAQSTVLIGRSPLTFDQINRFRDKAIQLAEGEVGYLPGDSADGSPVNPVITLPEPLLREWYRDYTYQVDPVHDDSPYFWHFVRFRDALDSQLHPSNKFSLVFSIAERVSLTFIIIVMTFAVFFLLLPFFAIREVWIDIPYKVRTGVYFASLGLGFMLIEIALIQKFTLFLGYPTRSLSVTLFGLLVFSGIGSLLSERFATRYSRSLGILMGALVAIVVFYQLGLPFVLDRFLGGPLGFRITLTIAMIAPLGLCLGAFMPIGLMTIVKTTSHKYEFVAWAWAVNCFFSVMATTLATIIAMAVGFKLVFLLAVGIYAIGVLALSRHPV